MMFGFCVFCIFFDFGDCLCFSGGSSDLADVVWFFCCFCDVWDVVDLFRVFFKCQSEIIFPSKTTSPSADCQCECASGYEVEEQQGCQ